MRKKNNPVRGFAGDLRLAIRLLPWLLLAYILLHGCIAPDSQPPAGQEYRRISPAELDSLWLQEVARWPGYRPRKV